MVTLIDKHIFTKILSNLRDWYNPFNRLFSYDRTNSYYFSLNFDISKPSARRTPPSHVPAVC